MVDPRQVVEQKDLADILDGAITGRGYRGPSTDPVVLARRLMESERVRVDVPGRLTVEQVADLAIRCGRAQTRVGELETALASLEEALGLERDARERAEATLRAEVNQSGIYLEQIGRLERVLAALGPRREEAAS